MDIKPLAASFRDEGNFVYKKDGIVYRQINKGFTSDYLSLMESGLYDSLISDKYIVNHDEMPINYAADKRSADIILKPEQIEFITYPYEWCFSQLKDAALLTLEVCMQSIEYGMILKDSSAYNIQFHKGRAIFIDTGSFSKYEEGGKWEGYQQFCKHFLSPLLLISKVNIQLSNLLKVYIDGVPLDLTSRLLPVKSWLSWSIFAHIHAHSISQNMYSDKGSKSSSIKKISKVGILGLLNSLHSAISNLQWKIPKTEWGDYYNNTNYSSNSSFEKKNIVLSMAQKITPSLTVDLGANDGLYSRIVAETGSMVISADIDPVAVESNYIKSKGDTKTNIIPIIQDLTNPSASIGWAHSERESLKSRSSTGVDLVMSLALVHHIAISNNVPFYKIAQYFSKLGEHLLIEFIPKSDSQVKKMLSSRKDIFTEYSIEYFELEFQKFYELMDKVKILNSERTLFLMKSKVYL